MSASQDAKNRMFIDYLSVEQVYPFDLPPIADISIDRYCRKTGERLSTSEPSTKLEGSYSTSITVQVCGRKLIVKGNPSAVDRLDNLFGYQTIEQCVAVYNRILTTLENDKGEVIGLPPLTKCTRLDFMQAEASKIVKRSMPIRLSLEEALDRAFDAEPGETIDDVETIQTVETSHRHTQVGDGMRITRIDITTNRSTGESNALQYIKALSTQRAGYTMANLWPDGRTCDWLTRDQYRKAYDKAYAIKKFQLSKARRRFGDESAEVGYLRQLIGYCEANGVVRMEQELKSEYLLREGLAWWGCFDEERFKTIHGDFLAIDERLTVTAMDFETISEHLVSQGVVNNTKAANTTAQYALAWMGGKSFDFGKSQVKIMRARLRQIGIDIANPCDTTRFSPVVHVASRDVVPVDVLAIPTWYRRPAGHLQLVAA
ncbi:phage/plasmid replication protein [Pseudomonas sp. D1-3]